MYKNIILIFVIVTITLQVQGKQQYSFCSCPPGYSWNVEQNQCYKQKLANCLSYIYYTRSGNTSCKQCEEGYFINMWNECAKNPVLGDQWYIPGCKQYYYNNMYVTCSECEKQGYSNYRGVCIEAETKIKNCDNVYWYNFDKCRSCKEGYHQSDSLDIICTKNPQEGSIYYVEYCVSYGYNQECGECQSGRYYDRDSRECKEIEHKNISNCIRYSHTEGGKCVLCKDNYFLVSDDSGNNNYCVECPNYNYDSETGQASYILK